MCGVPVHAAEGYLLTLIRKGFRVAVCEQMEDPAEARKRGAKSVVRREVVRLVTPGTLTEESLLEARRHNYLAAFAEVRGEGAFAWVDVSTGDLTVDAVPAGRARADAGPPRPARGAGLRGAGAGAARAASPRRAPWRRRWRGRASTRPPAEARVAATFRVRGARRLRRLRAGPRSAALGAIVDYLELTQRGRLPLLRPPVREGAGGLMQIDAATRRNLELTRSLAGGREGSLLAAIDRTVTGGGRAAARDPAERPLDRRRGWSGRRQDAVAHFHEAPDAGRDGARACCAGCPTSSARCRGSRSTAAARATSPRSATALVAGRAAARGAGRRPARGAGRGARRARRPRRADRRCSTRRWSPSRRCWRATAASSRPATTPSSTTTRRLRDEGRGVIAELQAEYVRRSGVGALKIRHNNVLGYFIETPATHAERMLNPPLAELFVHRQTTANAVRFTTLALAEIETKILNAGGHALEIEKRIFEAPARRGAGARRPGRRDRPGAGRDRRRQRARRSRPRRGLGAPGGRREPGLPRRRRAAPGGRAGAAPLRRQLRRQRLRARRRRRRRRGRSG